MRTTIIFLFFLPLFSFAQYSISEDLLSATILIENQNGGSGSGFFFEDSSDIYIITARHVIFTIPTDKRKKIGKENLISENGLIKFYAGNSDKTDANEIKCDFSKLYDSGYIKFSEKDDIVVIKIGKINVEGFRHIEYCNGVTRVGVKSKIIPLSYKDIGQYNETRVGNDIYIFGYPRSLGIGNENEYDFERPLLRKGTLAGRNIKNRTIIIDCPSFGGNSGGPVYEITFDKKVKLIGIVVSFIPYTEIWKNVRYGNINQEITNSGYSVVEPIDKIVELIKK
ncbi:MAG TPA: serine protease [Saprospiraceae bacterium]|nr:serine protease [Saprospiraceae bacterium]